MPAILRGLLDRLILVVGWGRGCIPSFIVQYRPRHGRHCDQVAA